jgi:hypothetical protein
MLMTPAWRSLNAIARAIYIEMASRYAGPDSNNGRIHYSVREAAAALHIGKSTASRGFRDLEERGFIVVMQKGAFSRKIRHATEWRLTEFLCDVTNQPPTMDFARWSPENLEHGTYSETVRYPKRDRSVPVAEPNV